MHEKQCKNTMHRERRGGGDLKLFGDEKWKSAQGQEESKASTIIELLGKQHQGRVGR